MTLSLASYCLPLSPQTGKQHWGFIQTVHFQASSFASKWGACWAVLTGERGNSKPQLLLNQSLEFLGLYLQ